MPPSPRPFMGAILYNDAGGSGATFRVWAPFANTVAVAGDFNRWSTSANPLFQDGGSGYWSVDVPGAAVNQEYLFVLTNPSAPTLLWRMDPYARQITRAAITGAPSDHAVIGPSNESLAAVDGYSTPAWNQIVIYELNVRTFLSDPSSFYTDQNGVRTGTFATLQSKLDYLQWLGVNAVEIMPLGEYLTPVSAGYNYAYMFAVEDEFGGPDGFRTFVQQAHQRGIAVIVDVVYNHVGANSGDMWEFDAWSTGPDFGGIYFYNDWRQHTSWGPRLDYGRSEVCQYLRDNALRWLQQRYADGLRWDSVGSIRNVFDQNNDPSNDIADGWGLCQRINDEVRQTQPWKISIAEDLKDNEWITKSTGAGGAGFSAQWGANFFWRLHDAMTAPEDGARDMNAVAEMLGQTYNADAFQRVIYTESHDGVDGTANPPMARVPEMIWPGHADSWASKKRSTLGAAALMTAPGIPMIFMGQEFLAWGDWEPNQVLDWSHGWQFGGITNLYRDLIHLRRNWFNNTRGLQGQFTHIYKVDNVSKVLAYHRWSNGGAGDDVVIVLNFGNQGYNSYSLGFPRGGLWKVRFNSDWNGYDAFFGNWMSYDTNAGEPGADNMPCSGNIGIGPYSAVIFSQDQ